MAEKEGRLTNGLMNQQRAAGSCFERRVGENRRDWCSNRIAFGRCNLCFETVDSIAFGVGFRFNGQSMPVSTRRACCPTTWLPKIVTRRDQTARRIWRREASREEVLDDSQRALRSAFFVYSCVSCGSHLALDASWVHRVHRSGNRPESGSEAKNFANSSSVPAAVFGARVLLPS